MHKDFLRYFGEALVILLEEKGIDNEFYKNSKVSKAKAHSLQECIYINKKDPFGVHFTPNGNYGAMLSGTKLSGVRRKSAPGPGPNIHSLVLDCDFKYYHGEAQDFLKDIVGVCVELGILPTFVSCTTPPSEDKEKGRYGGYHIYFLINGQSKQGVYENYGSEFFKLNDYINSKFPGYDAAPFDINSTIRLPQSYHRKFCEIGGDPNPKGGIYYGVVNDGIMSLKEWNSGVSAANLSFISEKDIEHAFKYMKAEESDEKESKRLKETYSGNAFTSVNKIPFPDLIKALKSTPRLYKSTKQYFDLDTNRVLINGEHNNGYKYRPEKNVLNCFSGSFHPREERPCGKPIHFLFKYFYGDKTKIADFLFKEFGIKLVDNNVLTVGEDIQQTYSLGNDSLMVSNQKVILQNSDKKNSRNILFKKPFEFLGVTKTDVNQDKLSQLERERKVYAFKLGDEHYLREQFSSKRSFNQKYSRYGCHFFGTDDEIGTFFTILDHLKKITEYKCISKDGYYGDFFAFGGNLFGLKPENYLTYMSDNYLFNVKNDGKLGLQEFFDKFRTLYSDHISITAFLTTIALIGMDYRTFDRAEVLGPQVLLTGTTKSGKTTIAYIMKGLLGIDTKTREYSFSNMTADSLAKNSTAGCPMFIEEVTGSSRPQTEDVLREVINKNVMTKGSLTGTVNYYLRSPVFGLGERAFTSESLNNRFCSIICDKKYKKGNPDDISVLIGNSCIKEIFNGYLSTDRDDNIELHKYYQKMLNKEHKIDDRASWLRSYSLVVNRIFDLGLKDEEVIQAIKEQLKKSGSSGVTRRSDPQRDLVKMVIKGYQQRKLTCLFSQTRGETSFSFMFDEGFYQEYRYKIFNAIEELHSQFPELINKIEGTDDGYNVSYDNSKSGTAFDKTLHSIFYPFSNMLKGCIIETGARF